MADHIDYAAAYLRDFPEKERMTEPDFPWEGMVISMFQYLAARGFEVEERRTQ